MKWRLLPLALLACVTTAPLRAQSTVRVDGTVRDSAAGTPLAGTTILVLGTKAAATAAADGKYTLRVAPGTYLVRAQRIGYAAQQRSVEIVAGRGNVIDFVLAARATQLEAVVAVGYGTQRKRDLTGAVTVVGTGALEKAPLTSIEQFLAGTAPGVVVNTASNAPGGGISVRVRGNSSISGNAEP
ncbi:MAG: TonB-dependent receptor, partial [Gemmatimonadaceae bacterium]|nr:TonB-dependent receptor [Gemmatimonadaceae bacterium]